MLAALTPVAAQLGNAASVAMDDEYTLDLFTAVGGFSFHKDPWGAAFLAPDDPRTRLETLRELLAASPRFVEVTSPAGARREP